MSSYVNLDNMRINFRFEMAEEPLSKNELKRRMKAEKKAAEKAEKAKAQPAKPNDSAKANKVNEEEISPNEYLKLR